MIHACSKNFWAIINRLLIAAVVFGLFFSSGEGIRLMPFPDAPATSDTKGFVRIQDEVPGYSDSVLKLGQSVAIIKSTPFRDGIRQVFPVSPLTSSKTTIAAEQFIADGLVKGPINRFTAPSLSDCRSDRAPPVHS